MERRLAAILAADVVGYSRLMGEDETGTLERLKQVLGDVMQPQIGERGGRIVKLMGDGLLAEFPSIVEAVQCATTIQETMALRDSDLDDQQQIKLRIGVNLGDIIVEGSDIYGDGVNVAARLEGLAEAGGVCVSGPVFEMVENKLELRFRDIGEQTVKNIAKPVRAYRVRCAGTGEDRSADPVTETAQSDKPSIAVLPFSNMSQDPEQDYFSDGLTEDLITELSRFRELAVVSRNSSFVFKGETNAIKDVGEKLNAHYIVEGSVRKAGNRVRVTAQLIDAQNDAHIWAERYERGLEDIFAVQDDLVRHVAGTLIGRLEAEQTTKVKSQSAEQMRAYDLFLRGREHFTIWSVEDNPKAEKFLKSALEIEPDHAAALALLAEVLLRSWLGGWGENPDEEIAESFRLAKRAVEVDDRDSRTHTALGLNYLFHDNHDKAKHHFELAGRLNPNDTRVPFHTARHAILAGDSARAVELCQKARTLNPFGKYSWNLGFASFIARDYEGAIACLETIGNPPAMVRLLLAGSHAMAGNDDKARQVLAEFRASAAASPVFSSFRSKEDWRGFLASRWPFRNPDDMAHLLEALRKAGLEV